MMHRILVCGVNWIGDSIMTMPALQVFKEKCPDVHIAMLVKRPLEQLWQMHSAPDEIIPLEEGLPGSCRTVTAIREYAPHSAYILPHSYRSALLPFLARVPERYGMHDRSRDILLTKSLRMELLVKKPHQAYEYMTLLMPKLRDDLLPLPELTVPEEATDAARRMLNHAAPLIGLLPGAARGSSKRWPAERFVELGKQWCAKQEGSVAVLGAPNEAPMCEKICQSIGPQALNLAGKTNLKEWAACLKCCDVVVANDSGGMHLAAAVGTRVVALYGLTDPEKTGPMGSGHTILQEGEAGSRDIARVSEEAEERLSLIASEKVYQAAVASLPE